MSYGRPTSTRGFNNDRATYAATVRPDRRVHTLTVVCPTCGADLGEKCVSSTGTHGHAHASRRRMAVRMDNQRRSEEGTP